MANEPKKRRGEAIAAALGIKKNKEVKEEINPKDLSTRSGVTKTSEWTNPLSGRERIVRKEITTDEEGNRTKKVEKAIAPSQFKGRGKSYRLTEKLVNKDNKGWTKGDTSKMTIREKEGMRRKESYTKDRGQVGGGWNVEESSITSPRMYRKNK